MIALFILIVACILFFVVRKSAGTTWIRTTVFWVITGFFVALFLIYGVNTHYKEEVLGGFDTVEQALDYYDYGKGDSITDVYESPTSAFVVYNSDSDNLAKMVFIKKNGKWIREYKPYIEQGDIQYGVYLYNIGDTNEWYVYADCVFLDDINGPEDIQDMYHSEFIAINEEENDKDYLANVWMEQPIYTISIGDRTLEIDLTDA